MCNILTKNGLAFSLSKPAEFKRRRDILLPRNLPEFEEFWQIYFEIGFRGRGWGQNNQTKELVSAVPRSNIIFSDGQIMVVIADSIYPLMVLEFVRAKKGESVLFSKVSDALRNNKFKFETP